MDLALGAGRPYACQVVAGGLSALLNTKWAAWKSAWDEAVRRDDAEGKKLRSEGYTLDGSWKTPDGGMMMDGPGSYPSRMKHLEDVAKERGLDQDITKIKAFVEKLKGMSHR